MPRRSNAFQRLIAFIEQQLAAEGAVVRESVLLKEVDSDDTREVDILIEGKSGAHEYRFALECRDHRRPQGKTWIDSLQGKYAHLPIHKVIAVSASGFTDSAYRCAQAAHVTLLTLQEAFEADWVAQVANWKMGLVVFHHSLRSARIIYRGRGPRNLDPNLIRSCPIGPNGSEPNSTFEADVMSLYRRHADVAVREWGHEHFREIWKDGPGKEWDTNVPFTAADRFLHAPDGNRYEIAEIVLTVGVRYELHSPEPTYYTYNGARLATGSLRDMGDGVNYQFAMLFNEDGTPRALNLRTEAAAENGRASA